MRNIIKYVMILGILALSSCNDWLEVKPKSEIPEKNLFDTEEGFQDALVSCYIKMNSATLYGRTLTMRELEWMAQHWSFHINEAKTTAAWKSHDYYNSDVESTISSIYEGLYNVISQANSIILAFPGKGGNIQNPQVRAIIEAEALAIRAFCHFEILRLFGQMPKNGTKTVSLPYAETVSTASIPYYAFDAFFEKVLTDLTKAENLLKDTDPLVLPSAKDPNRNYYFAEENENEFLSYRRFRFNYFAVKALRARVLLYGQKTDAANTIAKELISGFTAADSKQKMELAGLSDFKAEHFSLPSECILALSNFEMANNIKNLFANNTPSLYQLAETVQQDIFAGQSMSENNRGIYVWNMTVIDNQGRICPTIRKYRQENANGSTVDNAVLMLQRQIIPLIRLSEVYLIAMETESSSTEVNRLYKEYMEARGIQVTTDFANHDEVMVEIIREYRREFFAEGQMFYTYKRLGEKNMIWTSATMSDNNYIVPLPMSEAKVN